MTAAERFPSRSRGATGVIGLALSRFQRLVAQDPYLLLGEIPRVDQDSRRALSLDSTLATTWGWYGLLAGRLPRT